MQVTPLTIEGSWRFTPVLRPDDRGVFLEAFKADVLAEAIGHRVAVTYTGCSSALRALLRGGE